MLTSLFDDENEAGGDSKTNKVYFSRVNSNRPIPARKETNFCGIINQGATCYLNTLIQTLFLTPEFRNGLFSLTPEELGLVPNASNTVKVRVIPTELQRLFSNLLLLNQDACSTNRLTESFGWNDNEALQQHDVQELNRILFAAIESSLVNTKQAQLIQKLYKGTIVNNIHCLSCSKTKQRDEEYLDIQVTVQGSNCLDMSLVNSFMIKERLDGRNQYKCENCNKYVDAEKFCKLKTLPPIVTLSLLRFTYDMKTFQRIKVSDKFEFPLEIDFKEYLEDNHKLPEDYSKYELFSVIIHSGSAYGGHYHTYIKDIEHLGNWKIEETKLVPEKVKKDDGSSEVTNNGKEIYLVRENLDDQELDYLQYLTPLDLLKAFIYEFYKYEDVKVEAICADLNKKTGMSWNKKYKPKYGPINKFLKKYDDTFEVSKDEKLVKLRKHDLVQNLTSAAYAGVIEEKQVQKIIEQQLEEAASETVTSKCDSADEIEKIESSFQELDINDNFWFDFDDSRVKPIKANLIAKQFEGKESAYMLFYRKKSLPLTNKNAKTVVPSWLLNEVNTANKELEQQRMIYEKRENEIVLNIHMDTDFVMKQPNNLLFLRESAVNVVRLKIDKRKKVEHLREQLVEHCTSPDEAMDETNGASKSENDMSYRESLLNYLFSNDDSNKFKYLVCKQTLFGAFFVTKVCDLNEPFSIYYDATIPNQALTIMLTTDSDQFDIGENYEPMRLLVKYYDNDYVYKERYEIFTKISSIEQVKKGLKELLAGNKKLILVVQKQMKGKTTNSRHLLNNEEANSKLLCDFDVKSGDYFIIENENESIETVKEMSVANGNTTSGKNQSDSAVQENIEIQLINCIVTKSNETENFNLIELNINKTDLISDLKVLAISAFSLDNISYDNCHLRYINNPNVVRSDLIHEVKKTNHVYSGLRVYETEKIYDLLISNDQYSNLFALCEERAPVHPNEITVKCCLAIDDQTTSNVFMNDVKCELLIDENRTIEELTIALIEKCELKTKSLTNGEQYYLKTIDWFGEPDQILNHVLKTCKEYNLANNCTVCLTKGLLILPNHVKVNVWKLNPNLKNDLDSIVNRKFAYFNEDTIEASHECTFVQALICKFEMKLEDLKSKLLELLSLEDGKIRIRLLKRGCIRNATNKKFIIERFKLKKTLFEWHKTIKQLNFTNEIDICVQPLDENEDEDSVNQGIILLDCFFFDFNDKTYKAHKEIHWNINNGATINSLKQAIVKEFDAYIQPQDAFQMHLAKRLVDKYDWQLIKDVQQQTAATEGTTTKKTAKSSKQTQSKVNLKNAPYFLDDGEIIAFLIHKPSDPQANYTISTKDFFTNTDNLIKSSQIDLSKLRKNKKPNDPLDGEGTNTSKRRNRRAEVGITIKTEDFTN